MSVHVVLWSIFTCSDVHHKPDALSSTTERTTLSPLAASPERDVPPPGRTPAGPSWRSQGRGRCRRQRGKGHRVTPGSRSGRSLKRLSGEGLPALFGVWVTVGLCVACQLCYSIFSLMYSLRSCVILKNGRCCW